MKLKKEKIVDRIKSEQEEEEIFSCPHCGIGEYIPAKGETQCFYCQQALDVYGEPA